MDHKFSLVEDNEGKKLLNDSVKSIYLQVNSKRMDVLNDDIGDPIN
jgi:hypothetical protein